MNYQETRWQTALQPAVQAEPPNGTVPPPSSGPRPLLRVLIDAARHQARLIATILIGGLIATLLVLLLVTPRYVATASILLDTRQQRVFNADTVLPSLNDDLYVVESQLEIIRSARIANRVLSALGPSRFPPSGEDGTQTSGLSPNGSSAQPGGIQVANLGAGGGTGLATDSAPPPPEPSPISSEMVEKLLRGMTVERKGRSYMVEVSYTDVSSERAAAIANAFVDAYVADQLEAKFQATRGANQWLSERVREIGQELANIEDQQQKFKSERQLVDLGDVNLLQKQISDYSLQLVIARGAVAEAEARLEQVRGLAEKPEQLLSLDVSLQSKVISEYRRQAAEIQRKIGESASRFGDQHASVIGAKAELESLLKEVNGETRRIVESASLNLEAANVKVKLLEEGLQKLMQRAQQLGEFQITLGEYKRDIDVSSDLYSSLLRRFKETRAQEKLQTADARIVSYAYPPLRPSYPKTGLVMVLAALGWLGAGFGIGIARELAHPSLRNAADVESAFGVECVAALPVVDPDQDGVDANGQRNLLGPIHWRVDEETGGSFNQAIFNLRQWTGRHREHLSRVVLVVSAQPAEGCSTVAVQLARYAARTGMRAVLMDADMRSSGISDALGVSAGGSYADAVVNGADAASALLKVPDLGLSVCPAPSAGEWLPLDVLGARALGEFFNHLRSEFDLIVIDAPPMAKYVDADALAVHADCALLVVKAGRNQQNDVTDSLRRLLAEERIMPGIVLNMA